MSADKYPSIFSRQMKAIVYLFLGVFIWVLVFAITKGKVGKGTHLKNYLQISLKGFTFSNNPLWSLCHLVVGLSTDLHNINIVHNN